MNWTSSSVHAGIARKVDPNGIVKQGAWPLLLALGLGLGWYDIKKNDRWGKLSRSFRYGDTKGKWLNSLGLIGNFIPFTGSKGTGALASLSRKIMPATIAGTLASAIPGMEKAGRLAYLDPTLAPSLMADNYQERNPAFFRALRPFTPADVKHRNQYFQKRGYQAPDVKMPWLTKPTAPATPGTQGTV